MFKKFDYKSLEYLRQDIQAQGLALSLSDNFDVFKTPVKLGNRVIPNSVVAHPMEGGDSDAAGSPTAPTFRKYERVAAGGFGLIWFEAVSVCEEGRSNPRQLWINQDTRPGFKNMVDATRKAASSFHKNGEQPLLIMQLNHSGRYSKPTGRPTPIIASHIPELDVRLKIDGTYPLVTDAYLDSLVEKFVTAAVLAKEAGFDGVDVKACHGYLLHELLSCYNRDGEYGGSFENRTWLMMRIVDAIRGAIPDPDFVIASRINIFDALPVSHGFGMAVAGSKDVDLTEPIKLTQMLVEKGVELVSITMGNPYFIPHINRPYDLGAYEPEETPLMGAHRLIKGAADLQAAVPEAKIVGVGYSWFRR
ncbi:MAG: flavin oxidoreductase/NADH oxidase, partial [Defluviitaleaceae bacterium]|nr:flavin oxidoreductase/NADH oxidase [Defluviitaleaceae bacterium]